MCLPAMLKSKTLGGIWFKLGERHDCTYSCFEIAEKKQKYRFNMALPDHVEVVKKKEVTLECSVSDPRAHVNWFRNDEPLEVSLEKFYFNSFRIWVVISFAQKCH